MNLVGPLILESVNQNVKNKANAKGSINTRKVTIKFAIMLQLIFLVLRTPKPSLNFF